jgi:hypothetical protein
MVDTSATVVRLMRRALLGGAPDVHVPVCEKHAGGWQSVEIGGDVQSPRTGACSTLVTRSPSICATGLGPCGEVARPRGYGDSLAPGSGVVPAVPKSDAYGEEYGNARGGHQGSPRLVIPHGGMHQYLCLWVPSSVRAVERREEAARSTGHWAPSGSSSRRSREQLHDGSRPGPSPSQVLGLSQSCPRRRTPALPPPFACRDPRRFRGAG